MRSAAVARRAHVASATRVRIVSSIAPRPSTTAGLAGRSVALLLAGLQALERRDLDAAERHLEQLKRDGTREDYAILAEQIAEGDAL